MVEVLAGTQERLLRVFDVNGRKPPPRKLHGGHFAFMRALAQGLDERASWNRYLSLEGEHADLRQVRRTIAWIRDEFAAAAKREHRPGTARLILLDPDRFAPAPVLPDLAEFAEMRGLGDFSEAEQLEAYEEAYPKAGRGGRGAGGATTGLAGHASRRGRVVERQLEALRWLQDLVAQDPKPVDSVAAWLNPSMAVRLERAGLPTLSALVARINDRGARWWVEVPGMGTLKASRILDWLRANEDLLGLRVGLHAHKPRAQLSQNDLAAVVPAATAIRPFEKFELPAELDGRAGRYRAPHRDCLLSAASDHEAVSAWLTSKNSGSSEGALSSTQRAYRKEAERLLLWSVLERKEALSSLAVEDAMAYLSFLANPPPTWCGPRYHQRWSPLWRPLEGPLSLVALRQSLTILKGLFAFLVSQRYVVENPFAALPLPANPQRSAGSSRAFSHAQWDHVVALLEKHGDDEVQRRLRRGMRWLYATGLRSAEITAAKCGDLERVEFLADDGSIAVSWRLTVLGKSGRSRQIPVPAELIDELAEELTRHGFEQQVDAASNLGIHILARFNPILKQASSWSASGLYQASKAFLASSAKGLDEADAAQLKKASVRWLRHSCGVHALQAREGHTAVPVQIVQQNLGHASPRTKSVHLSTGLNVPEGERSGVTQPVEPTRRPG